MRRLHARTFLALVPLVAIALLAGCGGSSPGQATKGSSREAQSEKKFADFARCLREHGVDAEVSSSPGEGQGLKVSPGKGGGEGGGMESAERACARFRPEPKQVDLSPQQKVEREEAVQKFAKCMREHGIRVEASAKGGGVQIGIHGHPGSGEPNPRSPAFQQAQSTCQKLLPGGGPGHGHRVGGPGGAESGAAGG